MWVKDRMGERSSDVVLKFLGRRRLRDSVCDRRSLNRWSQTSSNLSSVTIQTLELETHPCFGLDFPLTSFRLALPESYLLDLGLDSGFGSDSLVKLLAQLRYKVGFDIGISMNEII